jgi:CBS domain-containing protein
VTVTRKLRDIMSPAPACLAPTETVLAAAQAMKERGVGTVLVLTDGQLSGLVTDRDITVRVLAENRDPQTTLIGEICSNEVAALGPDDNVDQAARLVRERVVRRIPVLQDGIPVGVVSIGDLALEKDESAALSGAQAASPDSCLTTVSGDDQAFPPLARAGTTTARPPGMC